MSRDHTDDRRVGEGSDDDGTGEADRDDRTDRDEGVTATAADEIDGRIVDLLSWILDTETRAKIYVFLLANPGSTSEEVAQGTGLYPSTVREALAELHDEEKVSREKRASEGAGNNPYEYTAIQPSELVGGVVDQVQHELNTIVNLDRVLDRGDDEIETVDDDAEPVTITVDEGEDSVPFDDAESTSAGESLAPEEVEPTPGDEADDDENDETDEDEFDGV